MPALVDNLEPGLHANLASHGVPMTSLDIARQQGLHIQSFVLANMMPAKAMEATERQFGRLLCGDPEVATEMTVGKFPNDRREGVNPATGEERSRTPHLARYTSFDQINFPIDVLVLTGDNLETKPHKGLASLKPEAFPMDDIWYADELTELIKRGDTECGQQGASITVLSCLASHLALNFLHDSPKETTETKTFGVYDHDILDKNDPLVRGLGDSITSPHSRFGNVSVEQIEARNQELPEDQRLKILALSPDVGWLILRENLPNGNIRIYLQGHPEYDPLDLKDEWERDSKTGLALPANYFKNDNPDLDPVDRWSLHAKVLFYNILREACRIKSERQTV